MQPPDFSKNALSQRTSPSNHFTKEAGSESDSTTSINQSRKSPTYKSPKVMNLSNRSPAREKKRAIRVTELECQLKHFQEDLKKMKDQLGLSESGKQQALQEAEEAKKQLRIMSLKFKHSQHQLAELAASEEARIQELRKISQERDRAWMSELEAVQKQRSIDSAALISAMNEIHRLKMQLEVAVKSEAVQAKQSEIAYSELEALRQEMLYSLPIVENLKSQLRDSKQAEVEAQAMVQKTEDQLGITKTAIDILHSDGLKLIESFGSLASELDKSRAQVNLLEELVNKFQVDQPTISSLDSQMEHLRSALEEAEIKNQEEQIKNTVQIQSAYEMLEKLKSDSGLRQANLESELDNTKAEIVVLKAKLLDKETQLQGISNLNKKLHEEIRGDINQMASNLHSKLKQSIADIGELRAKLMDKERALQHISEENKLLKLEMGRKAMESQKKYESVIAELELVKASEHEAVMNLGFVTKEADKNNRRALRMAEQLDAAQAVKLDMEAELGQLKVHLDQWRKAAEAATAVLTTENSGRFTGRSSSLDSQYNTIAGKLMSSPFSDDLDDESPKKKNNYMMRRIGGLWKKDQK